MLILTRRVGESVYVGDDVKVTVLAVKYGSVRVGIEAPKSVTVHRQEIYERIHAEALAGTEPALGTPRTQGKALAPEVVP